MAQIGFHTITIHHYLCILFIVSIRVLLFSGATSHIVMVLTYLSQKLLRRIKYLAISLEM